MTELGKAEDEIFKSRRDDELNFRERRKRQNASGNRRSWAAPTSGVLAPSRIGERPKPGSVTAQDVRDGRRQPNSNWVEQCLQNQEAAVSLRAMLKTSTETGNKRRLDGAQAEDEVSGPSASKQRKKGRLGGVDASVIKEKPEKVRFWFIFIYILVVFQTLAQVCAELTPLFWSAIISLYCINP